MTEGSENNRAEAQQQNWFLEINGKKTGPFTYDQIEGFLAEGEIRPYYQVTAPHLEDRWISVQELVDSVKNAATTGLFHPPPRPSSSERPPEPVEMDGRTDPAISLFKALKTVQGRRTKPVPTPEPLQEMLIKPPFRLFPLKRRTKTLLGLCAALFVVTWMALAFFKRSATSSGTSLADQIRALRDMPAERSVKAPPQKTIISAPGPSRMAVKPAVGVPPPEAAREEQQQNDARPADAPQPITPPNNNEENPQPQQPAGLEQAPAPYPPPNVIAPNQPVPPANANPQIQPAAEENNGASPPEQVPAPAPVIQPPVPAPAATSW